MSNSSLFEQIRKNLQFKETNLDHKNCNENYWHQCYQQTIKPYCLQSIKTSLIHYESTIRTNNNESHSLKKIFFITMLSRQFIRFKLIICQIFKPTLKKTFQRKQKSFTKIHKKILNSII